MDNKEKTKEYIKVMQAYVDGVEIEYSYKNANNFSKAHSPSWNWNEFDYRIKQIELIPGRWYNSISWASMNKFISMDGELYVFKRINNTYLDAHNLPSDINEVPEPSI